MDGVAETSNHHGNSGAPGGMNPAKCRQTVKVNFKDLGHWGGVRAEESWAGVLREAEDREGIDDDTGFEDLVSARSAGIFEVSFSVEC